MSKTITQYNGKCILIVTEEDGIEKATITLEFDAENSLGKHARHFIPSLYDLLKLVHINYSTISWFTGK